MTKFDRYGFAEILQKIIDDSDPELSVLDLSRRKITDIEAQQISDALDEADNKTLKQIILGENLVSSNLQDEINSKLKIYSELKKQEVESEEENLGYLPAVKWDLFAPPEAEVPQNEVKSQIIQAPEVPKEFRPSTVRSSPRIKRFKAFDLSSVKEKVENHEAEIAALKAKNSDLSNEIEDLKEQVNKLSNPLIAEEILERTAQYLSRQMSEKLDEELAKLASSNSESRPSASVKAKKKQISKITEAALEKHNSKSRSSI